MHSNNKTWGRRAFISTAARSVALGIQTIIRTTLIVLITGIRPLLGPAVCKYPIGCTQFAITQLKNKKLLNAVYTIVKRVISCNPLT